MKSIFVFLVSIGFALNGRCNSVNYFEIKVKGVVIFNSSTSVETTINFKRSEMVETDLMEIAYYEHAQSIKNEYELQLHSPDKSQEVLFVDVIPKFTFHLSWLMQRKFLGGPISISMLHKKYDQTSSNEILLKIVDIVIS